MIIKQIRLVGKDKERLSRLKGKTGITHWNTLCRWALCYSLSEPSIPREENYSDGESEVDASDSIVEMSWGTFGGEYEEIYELLIKERCKVDGLGTDPETLAKYFMLHLRRGISYLSGTNLIKSVDDLFGLVAEKMQPENGEESH